MSFLKEHKDGVILQVHAQPRATKNRLVGLHGDALKIAVQAPPVDSAANEAIRSFLAEIFSLPGSKVLLRSGEKSRKKFFLLLGVRTEAADALIKDYIK